MQAGQIVILMAGATFYGVRAVAVRPTPNLHSVPVSVVSLPGKVAL
jgi:hypothetical protein